MSQNNQSSPVLEFNISEANKSLITRAAEASDMSISEFVLSSATSKARQVLDEKNIFLVSDEHFEWLLNYLEDPSQVNTGLDRLMGAKYDSD